MPYEAILFKRDELYAQVWRTPVVQLAKQYGLSDVGLAKICRQLRVPLPERGYWAKVAAGERRTPPPLRKPRAGMPLEHRVSVWRSPLDEIDLGEDTKALLAAEAQRDAPLVSQTLDAPHPLVGMSLSVLRRRNARADELLSHPNKRSLDVEVTTSSLDRALRILDCIVKALEARGFRVEVTKPERVPPRSSYDQETTSPSVTRVQILNEWVPFLISEKTSPGPGPPRPSSSDFGAWMAWKAPPRQPTGKFELRIAIPTHVGGAPRRAWNDTEHQRIEACIGDFIRTAILLADRLRAARHEDERAERAREKEQRRREEEAQRQREEEARIKELEKHLECWREARDIRAYVAEAKTIIHERDCEITEGSELDRSLSWALKYADAIDPFTRLRKNADDLSREKRRRRGSRSTKRGTDARSSPG